MKKPTIIISSIAAALLLSGSSFAAGSLVNINVDPSIKILVNGEEFHPKNVNGEDVMTFVYEGTTYAPLRALAEAYGLEVGYNSELNMATVDEPAAKKDDPQTSSTETKSPETVELKTKADIEAYLKKNYSSITTAAGTTTFDFMVLENTRTILPYDYSINVEYDFLFFCDIADSLSLTQEQKTTAKAELKAFQKQLAEDLIALLPDKKLEGCYNYSYYKYPTIKEGYTSIECYEWQNFETTYGEDFSDTYYLSEITEFHWTNEEFVLDY